MKNTFKKITSKNRPDGFCYEIHVTEMCNYSCSYCNLSPMNKHTSIDFDKMFSLDLPSDTRIFLMGGEPTMDKFFFDIIEQCFSRGYNNIDVQTNLTFNVDTMIKKLSENNTPVNFYGSFHMEHSNITKFIDKCLKLKSADMYGGIHLMWLSKLNDKCMTYYKMMNSVLSNISLEPTLPRSIYRNNDWEDKKEMKKFIELGHVPLCDRFSKQIYLDDKLITVAEALAQNYENDIYGKKCTVPTNTVVFSVNKNKFYNCTIDCLYDHDYTHGSLTNGYCICRNKICCADVEFDKS